MASSHRNFLSQCKKVVPHIKGWRWKIQKKKNRKFPSVECVVKLSNYLACVWRNNQIARRKSYRSYFLGVNTSDVISNHFQFFWCVKYYSTLIIIIYEIFYEERNVTWISDWIILYRQLLDMIPGKNTTKRRKLMKEIDKDCSFSHVHVYTDTEISFRRII